MIYKSGRDQHNHRPLFLLKGSENMEQSFEFYRVFVLAPLDVCRRELTENGALEHQYELRSGDEFLKEMCKEHGYDVVATVFSTHIKAQSYDGRYSRNVIEWAKGYQTKLPIDGMPDEFLHTPLLGNTHPIVINSYAVTLIENEKELSESDEKEQDNAVSKTAAEQLYDKMFTAQESFREWLLGQTPDEILRHTYEYTVREDILMIAESDEITEDEAKKLLESDTPLDDIFERFDKKERDYMTDLRNTFSEVANEKQQKQTELEKG